MPSELTVPDLADFVLKQPSVCELLELSRAMVRHFESQGAITSVDGHYNLVATIRGVLGFYRKKATSKGDLVAQRCLTEAVKREILEMERDARKGKLISAKDAEQSWEHVITLFRARLLAMRQRLKEELSHAETPEEIDALLKVELEDAMAELSAVEYVTDDGPPADIECADKVLAGILPDENDDDETADASAVQPPPEVPVAENKTSGDCVVAHQAGHIAAPGATGSADGHPVG